MTTNKFIRGLIRQQLIKMSNLVNDPLKATNKKHKNIHIDKRCFILGSGHSILEHDLTKLKNEIVITQNNFHFHEDIAIIHPEYHIVVPKYQPKNYDTDWIKWLQSMENRLPDETIFFMGDNTKYLVEEYTNLSNRTFYIDHGLDPLYMKKAIIDISRRKIMSIQTVITQCLTIALYQGFDTIYLIGFDLDQVCRMGDRDNVRFYGNSIITKNLSEKANELKAGASGMDWYNMWMIWKQLNLLNNYAIQSNIKIINLTKGGLLNMFERDTYEEVVAKNLNDKSP